MNSIRRRNWSQLPFYSKTQALNNSSRVCIVLSDWPSVWGCYAELSRSWVPNSWCKLPQNLNRNLGSLSDTMLDGTPCNLTISLTYNWVNFSRGLLTLIGRKWADLVSWSTTTHIASCPVEVLGNPDTKSTAMQSHYHSGISNGCNIPDGFWCSTFTFWQTRQEAAYCATSFFIPGHQNILFRSAYILVVRGWILRLLLCASSKMTFLSSWLSGTQTLLL